MPRPRLSPRGSSDMQRQLPANRGLLARLMSAAILLAVLAVSFTLGLVLFLAVLGLAVLLGLALYLRGYWLRRKWRQPPSPPRGGGDVLEGEYTVKDEKPMRRP